MDKAVIKASQRAIRVGLRGYSRGRVCGFPVVNARSLGSGSTSGLSRVGDRVGRLCGLKAFVPKALNSLGFSTQVTSLRNAGVTGSSPVSGTIISPPGAIGGRFHAGGPGLAQVRTASETAT